MKKSIKKETKKKQVTLRVPTGIKGFDQLIEGGFKKNSINLVAGGPGSGKTLFAIAFLYYGIIKYNDNALYITFEEKKEKLYDDVKTFGWDLEKLEKEKKFVFLEYTPEQVKKLLVEGGGIIENIVEKYNIKRLAIDSITSFSLLYQDELTKKESSLALFELIGKWNCTAMLTSQDIGRTDNESTDSTVEFETDSIIILYHSKKKSGKRLRALEILKMRGTKHAEDVYSLEITRKGIEVKRGKVSL